MRKFAFFAASMLAAGPALAEPAEVSEIVVSGAPYAVPIEATTASVDVLRREALDLAAPAGLGDTLAGLPGVRSSFFGPGASRPVIRGLSGPRVLVLNNGIGLIDASALSPDHQVASDPQEAQRIEVLRGSAALLYGGSAIGGVVNVIDDRIPESKVAGVEGRLLASASSVDDGRTASAAVKAGVGEFVVSLDVLRRDSEDYEVPAPAESRRLLAAEDEPWPGPVDGVVANTAVELTAYGAGLSFIGDRGFLGAALKRTETAYGVPGHAHAHEDDHDHAADEGVRLDLEQTRLDLRGEWRGGLGHFERLRLAAGLADYEHREIEAGEVATRIASEGAEARLELVQSERDGWQGAVGLQALARSISAEGEEAFIPSVDISEVGVFTLQRLDRDRWGVEGGARVDRRTLESPRAALDFTNLSASVGGFLRPADGLFLGASFTRTARAPTEAELFADGFHAATGAVERGRADLDSEVAYAVDLTLHYARGAFTSDLHLFGARYDGFIDLRPTGETDAEGAAVFAYRQTDADFWGAEIELGWRLWEEGGRSFALELAADAVRGRTDLGPPARVPPWSASLRGIFEGGWWSGRLELREVGAQRRVAELELPTDGYRTVNASAVFRPLKDDGFKLFVEARNLTDAEAREHASFLKDLAPLPGRNLRVGVGYPF
ncbi:MAG: TonB-dependent receptor [Phenylobacterium sp.]|jgi:iron complex outermembrane receptor protein|uniref:TonB-dependent receptor n=1 Tax=Phenylobacterium sp. TaxID=1871053 RepID=UPI002A3692F1|nr:TonB-dependent receptor [Phenylobacterium sp.]MDX9996909.1 TonB-dependent receptor [Phenylobacterium sp.]